MAVDIFVINEEIWRLSTGRRSIDKMVFGDSGSSKVSSSILHDEVRLEKEMGLERGCRGNGKASKRNCVYGEYRE